MSEHPNAAAVRKGFEAFGAGDMDTMNELMSDDVAWHSGGRNMLSGDYLGKAEVFGLFAKVAQSTDSMSMDIHAIVADDTHAVALAKVTATRGDKTLHDSNVYTFHVTEGKMTECWMTAGDQYAADAFWTD